MTFTASSRRVSLRQRRLILLAILMLVAIPPALARQDDRQKPMDIRAGSGLAFMAPNRVSKLIGNVSISQGTLKASGGQAELYTDANTQVSRVVLYGSPQKQAHIQQLDDNGHLMSGDADKLDYDNISGIAMLIGRASIHQQSQGEIYGDKLVYNSNTGQMTAQARPGEQVHMIFLPKSKPHAPHPAKSTPRQTRP